jgi:hypothetical protein
MGTLSAVHFPFRSDPGVPWVFCAQDLGGVSAQKTGVWTRKYEVVELVSQEDRFTLLQIFRNPYLLLDRLIRFCPLWISNMFRLEIPSKTQVLAQCGSLPSCTVLEWLRCKRRCTP